MVNIFITPQMIELVLQISGISEYLINNTSKITLTIAATYIGALTFLWFKRFSKSKKESPSSADVQLYTEQFEIETKKLDNEVELELSSEQYEVLKKILKELEESSNSEKLTINENGGSEDE